VDLIRLRETVANTKDEKSIIEKIDIAGLHDPVATKNFSHVALSPIKDYGLFTLLISR
jgi:hypothetical protein